MSGQTDAASSQRRWARRAAAEMERQADEYREREGNPHSQGEETLREVAKFLRKVARQ